MGRLDELERRVGGVEGDLAGSKEEQKENGRKIRELS